jgi:diguanylate cyclase (GGDEF)-like protein
MVVLLIIIFLLLTLGLLSIFVFRKIDALQKINKNLEQEVVKHEMAETKPADQDDRITQLAHYDSLVGLPNRVFFNNILNKTINHANRHKKILAILSINLDNFKSVHVRFDNAAGDSILKEMGKRFSNVLRIEDVLAKLDGDEFIVLLTDIGKPKFASAVAEKLLLACSQPLTINSQKISMTASIGICIYPGDGHSLEELLNNVTIALDAAKRLGGNHYSFHTKEMDIEAHEYSGLANALRSALVNNEFVLYYQPKLTLKRGNISGVETLLRWSHPQHGLVNPEKFISIAEDTGLIIPIGEWVLNEACKVNKHWQNEGYEHLTIAVNLSLKQFYHPDIANMIAAALNAAGLDPNYLEIEITESIVMNDIEKTADILEKIKKTGVKISIDHFGAGYISIKHLKNIPVSAVKIDQHFIKGIPHIPNDIAITNAFIALAHNLGLEVIAEGVETIEQAQYLATQNCDVVQGYFLSHPVPVQKITLQFKKLMDSVL